MLMTPRQRCLLQAGLVGLGLVGVVLPPFSAQIVDGGWSKSAMASVPTNRIDFSGRDVPLREAIERLVPSSERERIVLEGDVDDRLVSWSSGRHWFDTLRTAVQRAGMTMQRRSDGLWVIAARRQGEGQRELVFGEASSRSGGQEGMRSAQTAPTAANPQTATRNQARSPFAWSARPGQSLEEVLRQWTDQAGWSLVYNTRISFIIESTIGLNGSFEEAVRTLIDGIEARPAPRAVLYHGNKTVVVATGFEDLRP